MNNKLVSGCGYCHLKADEHNLDKSNLESKGENDSVFLQDTIVYGDWIDDLSKADDNILLSEANDNCICEDCAEEERHYLSNINKFFPNTKEKVLLNHSKYKGDIKWLNTNYN